MFGYKRCLIARLSVICLIVLMLSGFAGSLADTPEDTTDSEEPACTLSNVAEFSMVGAGEENFGIAVEFIDMYVDEKEIDQGIKIGATTYVGLRDFSENVGRDVTIDWDAATVTATIQAQGLTITAQANGRYITANGRCLYLWDGIQVIDGNLMIPVRELAKAFGVGIIWNEEDRSCEVDTTGAIPIESADKFYNEEDMMWLARIINAESGNQALEGKIAVGNVVVNRVNDPYCPDSIFEVIFDTKHGVQFQPIISGAVYREPSEESIVAAKISLEGYNLVGDSLFFVNPEVGITGWFAQTRTYVVSLGDHDFYA